MRFVSCLAVLLLSCGGDDVPAAPQTFVEACALVAGCETPELAVAGSTEAIWRVRVVRDEAGAVTIAGIQEVSVPQAIGRPQGATDGDVALAALDAAGDALEIQLLRFPETLLLEPVDAFESPINEDLTGQAVDAVGYLAVAGAVETLVVVDQAGLMLTSTPAPAPGEATLPDREEGASREALVQPAPSSSCAHVLLLENNGDQDWYPPGMNARYPLREPTPLQRAVVTAALGRMTPMLCAGISRIAFVDLTDSAGTAGMVVAHAADLVLLNATAQNGFDLIFSDEQLVYEDARAYLMHTLFHEAAHTTEFLLNYEAREGAWADWGPTQRSLAAETVDNARMRGGFGKRWLALHASFEALGWVGPHLSSPGGPPATEAGRASVRGLDPAGLAAYGMISHYGTKLYHDDIADTVGWAMSAPLMRAGGRPQGLPPLVNDYGCVAMRAHTTESIPQSLAAVYAKLAFVRDLGLITDEVFESCAGPNISLPTAAEGITVYENGEVQRVFRNAPEGQIGRLDDRYVFELTVGGTAEFGGTDYPTTLRLLIDLGPTTIGGDPVPVDRISWPRGVFSLGTFEPHRFELRMPDEPAGDFDVYNGFVLVTEASNDRIVGSVVVNEALRPNAPVPVPQVFDPPIQFRFRLEN